MNFKYVEKKQFFPEKKRNIKTGLYCVTKRIKLCKE